MGQLVGPFTEIGSVRPRKVKSSVSVITTGPLSRTHALALAIFSMDKADAIRSYDYWADPRWCRDRKRHTHRRNWRYRHVKPVIGTPADGARRSINERGHSIQIEAVIASVLRLPSLGVSKTKRA